MIRGSDHRPNEEPQRRIARAIGGELPEVVHHGLLLGEDGKKLSKRHGHASVADFRDEGIPACGAARVPRGARASCARRASRPRAHRPARDRGDRRDVGRGARASADAPVETAQALRGARTLVEAREIARQLGLRAPPRCRRTRLRRSSASWSCVPAARHARRVGGARHRARAQGGGRRPPLAPARTHRRASRAGALGGAGRAAGRRGAGSGRASPSAGTWLKPGTETPPSDLRRPPAVYDRGMRLQDTLTGELVELPPPPEQIGIYVCGPTVYQRAHIGNARPFVVFMWLARWLRGSVTRSDSSTTSRT